MATKPPLEKQSTSIVIASLGDDRILKTVDMLLKSAGEFIYEIIIVLPPKTPIKSLQSSLKSSKQVRIVSSEKKGQVSQRSLGLSMANGKFVMQLDDDVWVGKDVIPNLINILAKKGDKSVVAPICVDMKKKQQIIHRQKGPLEVIRSIFYFLCGAKFGYRREGQLTASALAFWIDINYTESDLVEVDWLPGAIALCHRRDLILNDYFPFEGRAFSEDLIHSYLWRRNGASLYVATQNFVLMEHHLTKRSIAQLHQEFKVKLYLVNLMNGSKIGLCLWYCVSALATLIRS